MNHAAILRNTSNGRRGFTLVELLIVIGIITLLVAILMPALSKARRMARQIQCASNLRNLVNYTFMYGNENRGAVRTWNNITQVFDQLNATGANYKYDAGNGTLNNFCVTGRNYLLQQGATEPCSTVQRTWTWNTNSGIPGGRTL